MKKLLMTTAIASIFSFNVMADVTKADIEKGIEMGNSQVCNTLDHGVEFNKTELSQFDKCWLSIHKADEKSGVSGNIFWMKVDGKFISMPTKELFQSGSKEAAKEVIKEKIIEEVIVERIVERVTVDTAEIERLNARIDILAPLAAEVPTLRTQLAEAGAEILRLQGVNLREYTRGLRAGESATVDLIVNNINTALGTSFTANNILPALSYVNQRAGSNIFDISGANAGTYFNQAYVDTAVANALDSSATKVGIATGIFTGIGNSFPGVTIQSLNAAADGTDSYIAAVRAMARHLVANMPTSTGTSLADNDGDGRVDSAEVNNYAAANADTTRHEFLGTDGAGVTLGANHVHDRAGLTQITSLETIAGVYERAVIGNRGLGAITIEAFNNIEAALNDAWDAGYDEGYNDGYEAGYHDGYTDGFQDGVESVR